MIFQGKISFHTLQKFCISDSSYLTIGQFEFTFSDKTPAKQ